MHPFRQINVTGWLHDTIGCGYTLSVMDCKARARAAAHGVSLGEIGFVDPFYAYYDSKLLKKRSPLVPLDRLPKNTAEYKRLGVRILGVYPPSLQGLGLRKPPRLAAGSDRRAYQRKAPSWSSSVNGAKRLRCLSGGSRPPRQR